MRALIRERQSWTEWLRWHPSGDVGVRARHLSVCSPKCGLRWSEETPPHMQLGTNGTFFFFFFFQRQASDAHNWELWGGWWGISLLPAPKTQLFGSFIWLKKLGCFVPQKKPTKLGCFVNYPFEPNFFQGCSIFFFNEYGLFLSQLFSECMLGHVLGAWC